MLPDGEVLVAGGFDGGALPGAELYDPVAGTWSVTGNLSNARYLHTATLLANGQVLVAGGLDSNIAASPTAELYDPASRSWTETGSLTAGRYWHTATLLDNGEVLAVGGFDSLVNVLGSAELYEPGTAGTTTVDGHGAINTNDGLASFIFNASESGQSGSGTFSYKDPDGGLSIAKGQIDELTIDGSSARFSGKGRTNDGSQVRFRVRVSDGSETGNPDTFSINLSTGYSAGGDLTRGDITIH
jgi:hypothetical protein